MKDEKKSNKQQSMKITRRGFLGGTAALAASTIVPRHVLGGSGYTPPSDKLNIAAIGAGGQGASNVEGCATENIVALCDVDSVRATETFEKFPNAKRYTDFREMLEKQKDIDAVIVATADHTHAVAAMMAIKMGKHVYCQKPLTHTVFEARKLTEAAREAKVATQMGNQGHSGDGVQLICKLIWDGAIGSVREVESWTNRPIWPQGIYRPRETARPPRTLNWDLWLGPAPNRPYHPCYAPFNWRGWWDFGCGALGDMACHILDPVYAALKLSHPTSVEANSPVVYVDSSLIENTIVETGPVASIVRYEFPARENMPPVKLTWYDGGMKPARPEELEPNQRMGSIIFIGDKGKLMCGEYGDKPQILGKAKLEELAKPQKTPAEKGRHEQNWIKACKGGEPASSNFDYSGPFTEIVLLGNIAIRVGRKLYWDGVNMTFTNEPDANQYIQTQYREGWSL